MGSLDRHAATFGAVRSLLAAHGLPGDRLETWKDGSNLLVRPVRREERAHGPERGGVAVDWSHRPQPSGTPTR